jgi:hypothetical protein
MMIITPFKDNYTIYIIIKKYFYFCYKITQVVCTVCVVHIHAYCCVEGSMYY